IPERFGRPRHHLTANRRPSPAAPHLLWGQLATGDGWRWRGRPNRAWAPNHLMVLRRQWGLGTASAPRAHSRSLRSEWARGVMVQRELEFASAQRSGNTVTGGTFHERETQTVLGPGKGGHPTAASPGEEAGVRFVRSVRHSSHALLPLAEGVLRERRRRL